MNSAFGYASSLIGHATDYATLKVLTGNYERIKKFVEFNAVINPNNHHPFTLGIKGLKKAEGEKAKDIENAKATLKYIGYALQSSPKSGPQFIDTCVPDEPNLAFKMGARARKLGFREDEAKDLSENVADGISRTVRKPLVGIPLSDRQWPRSTCLNGYIFSIDHIQQKNEFSIGYRGLKPDLSGG